MPQSAVTAMLHQPPSIQERLLDNASQGPAVDLIPSSAATIASSRGDHRFRRKRSAMHHWPWKHRAEMPNVRPCPITAARREGKLTVGEGALTWAGYEHPDDRSFHPIADFHHVLHRSYSHGYPQGLRDYSHPLLASRGSANRHSDCACVIEGSLRRGRARKSRSASSLRSPGKQAEESRYLTPGRRFNTYRPVLLVGTVQPQILFHVKHVTSWEMVHRCKAHRAPSAYHHGRPGRLDCG